MAEIDYQNLQEIVDAADVAVRAANQLRLAKHGEEPNDLDALRGAHDFISHAKRGGAFIAEKQSSNLQFQGTLKPLNWTADTYVLSAGQGASLDYDALSDFLGTVENVLRLAIESAGAGIRNLQPDQIETPISFLEALSRILRAKAFKRLRGERDETEVGVLA